jgi:hypothetical protein
VVLIINATPKEGFIMKRKIISKVLAASVLAFAVSTSQAAVVTEWGFALDMKWDTSKTVFAQSKDGPGTYDISGWYNGGRYNGSRTAYLDRGRTSAGLTEISWGSNRVGAGYLNPDPLYARSGIVIERPNVTGNIATSFEGQDTYVTSANMFSHYNGAIPGTSDTLSRAKLDVTVQIILPGYGDVVKNLTNSFTVHFLETPNEGKTGCSYSFNCDDDVFAVISGMDFTNTFEYDGVVYTLNYFESTDHIKQMSTAACQHMGFGAGSCYGFTTPETGKTDIMFNFSITAVPEPETYAMLLAGLGMVGFVVRRRKIYN